MAQPYYPNSMGGGGQMGGMQPMGGMPGDYTVEVSAGVSHPCLTLSSHNSSQAASEPDNSSLVKHAIRAQEEYCGPQSMLIGGCLCFFGFGLAGLLPLCCPCDKRITTYRNGVPIHVQ